MSMTLIEHIEVDGTVGEVIFSSIPQDGTDLYLVASARGDNFQLYLFPNSNESNLSYRHLLGNGATASSATSQRWIINLDTATANTFGVTTAYIPNYAGSTAKSVSQDSVNENNATTATQSIQAMLWNDTTAISSIKLVMGSLNDFDQYSSFTLYKVTAGSDGTTTVS